MILTVQRPVIKRMVAVRWHSMAWTPAHILAQRNVFCFFPLMSSQCSVSTPWFTEFPLTGCSCNIQLLSVSSVSGAASQRGLAGGGHYLGQRWCLHKQHWLQFRRFSGPQQGELVRNGNQSHSRRAGYGIRLSSLFPETPWGRWREKREK